MAILNFSEVEIQNLFGHEAADDESIERLREYYFKSNVYEQVVTDLPLRILVGHKGIGKSALFHVSMSEDLEKYVLPILIKPDDIIDLKINGEDFLKTIRDWKNGLIDIIARKALESLGTRDIDTDSLLKHFGGRILQFIQSTLKDIGKINFGSSPNR